MADAKTKKAESKRDSQSFMPIVIPMKHHRKSIIMEEKQTIVACGA